MALLELPRGCDYWNDERMKFIINGTSSTIHEFDGCMYGLKLTIQRCRHSHQETMEDRIVGGFIL